jgi:hypothetical protein
MNTVVVNDPRIDVTSELSQVISRGGQRLTQYVQSADGNSTSQSNFSFQPPSTKIIVDRHFQLRVRVRLTAVGGNFQLGTASALRQAPLSSIIEVMNVSLNGGNISDNISRRIHPMLRYNNNAQSREGYASKSPMMPDQYQNYEDWKDPLTGGSSRNPLAAYGETLCDVNRGAFVPLSQSDTVLEYELTEPIFMSPFMTGLEKHQDQGFVNINQIDVNIKYVSNLERIFSHYNEAPNALTGINVEFISTPEMLVNYITPDISQPLPLLQVLPYYKFNDYIKNEGTKAAGFVKRSRQTESLFTSDAYARIDNLNLLWNNESSLFATYTKQGIFDITRRNGCNISYPQFDKFTGSVLRIEMGIDLGLMGLSPGVMGQFTISAQLRCTNGSNEPIEFESYLVTTLEGSLEITENALALNLGNLTVPMVADAENNAEVIHHTNPALGIGEGGSFWSSLKHFVNKAAKGVGKAAQFTGKYIAPALSAVAPEFGAPLAGVASAIGTGADVARRMTGGRLSGGNYGQLRKRLSRRR